MSQSLPRYQIPILVAGRRGPCFSRLSAGHSDAAAPYSYPFVESMHGAKRVSLVVNVVLGELKADFNPSGLF